MEIDRFNRLRTVFDEALERESEERAEYVRGACGDDPGMADEVLRLLRYEARGGDAKTVRPLELTAAAFDLAEANTLIGRRVGRFRLDAEIASGVMGRVFRANRVGDDLEQTVALKLIRRELFNESLLKRFSSERNILASLNHPGIAHFIDAGVDEFGVPFVAMEYVDGLPLLEYCARHAPSIRDRILIFRQILAAVSFAHRALVVHRDLKPENVLVTSTGRAKLLDFGIAKALEAESRQTKTVDHFFTPAYAAPEQLLRQDTTVACDVYALGAILYVLLTGAPPIDTSAASAAEIERRVLKVPPAPMRATAEKRGAGCLAQQGIAHLARWSRQLDGDLDNIVQKALRKEPDARYASVEQLDDDLDRYLAQRPVRASGSGWAYRAGKFCERNVFAVAVAAVAIVAVAVGAHYVAVKNEAVRQERDRARAALAILKNAIEINDVDNPDNKTYHQSRKMLAAASREAAVLEKTRPELFREIAYEIAEIQINVAAYDEALSLIQRANRGDAARPERAGPSDRGLLLEMRASIMAQRYPEARALIDAHRDRFRGDPEFNQQLANVLIVEAKYAQAIALCERFVADPRVLRSPELLDRFRMSLAEAYRSAGRVADAMKVMNRILSERKRRHGENHKQTFAAELWRIQMLLEANDHAGAERELLAIAPKVATFDDEATGDLSSYHDAFGRALFGLQRPGEAVAHFRKALRAEETGSGRGLAGAHYNLGIALALSQRDHREAYAHFWKAIEETERTLGPAALSVGTMRWEVADGYLDDGDPISARRTLTPPHAPDYFAAMHPSEQREYLRVLHRAFGPQDCAPERKTRTEDRANLIANRLICRYDPGGKYRS